METKTPEPVFGAYVAPVKPHYRRWVLGFLVFALAAYALAARRDPASFTVITRHGIRQVRLEMTTNQVHSVLGKPMSEAADGCLRYGIPQLDQDFDVYKVCFAEGRVREVKTERFEVRRVGDDGLSPE